MKLYLTYFLLNWKMIIHVIFKTYHFGVNNEWWSKFPSIFGAPLYKRWNIIASYRQARFRAVACYFITKEEQRILFSNIED
jgi:hypothetical protein